MKQEHGTYQSASGHTVEFWKTSDRMLTLVAGVLTVHSLNSDMSHGVTNNDLAVALEMIGWVSK